MFHHSWDAVFQGGKWCTPLNAADEVIMNKHVYSDTIEESKPRGKPPTDIQTEQCLDDDLCQELLNLMKKSREMASLAMSAGDASKPLAEGSYRNCAGKVAKYAQLALEADEFGDIISICTGAVIPNQHDYEDGMDNPKTYSAAMESLIAEKLDTAMKDKLDLIGQHH
jgi:hypothetical protein